MPRQPRSQFSPSPAFALPVGLPPSAETGYRLPRLVIRAGSRAGIFMRIPIARLVFASLLASSPLLGQTPVFVPVETREPPLADEVSDRSRGGYDPDETSEVQPAQY